MHIVFTEKFELQGRKNYRKMVEKILFFSKLIVFGIHYGQGGEGILQCSMLNYVEPFETTENNAMKIDCSVKNSNFVIYLSSWNKKIIILTLKEY